MDIIVIFPYLSVLKATDTKTYVKRAKKTFQQIIEHCGKDTKFNLIIHHQDGEIKENSLVVESLKSSMLVGCQVEVEVISTLEEIKNKMGEQIDLIVIFAGSPAEPDLKGYKEIADGRPVVFLAAKEEEEDVIEAEFNHVKFLYQTKLYPDPEIPSCAWRKSLKDKASSIQEFSVSMAEGIRNLGLGYRLWRHTRKEKAKGRSSVIDPFRADNGGPTMGVPLGGLGTGTIGRGWRGDFNRFTLQPGYANFRMADGNQFSLRIGGKREGGGGEAEAEGGGKGKGEAGGEGEEPALCTVLYPDVPDQRAGSKLKSAWDWELSKESWGEDIGHYHALFPRAWTTYNCFRSHHGIYVKCKQISPVIAHNYKESSFPVSVFVWTIENLSDVEKDVSLMFTWENTIGASYKHQPPGSFNFPFHSQDDSGNPVLGIQMNNKKKQVCEFAKKKMKKKSTFFDEFNYAIAAHDDGDLTFHSATIVTNQNDSSQFWNHWKSTGKLPNHTAYDDNLENSEKDKEKPFYKCKKGERIAGGLSYRKSIPPASSRELVFAIAWDNPIVRFGSSKSYMRRYTKYYPPSPDNKNVVQKIAADALLHWRKWELDIKLWQSPVLDDPSLPHFYKYGLFNELYFLTAGGSEWIIGKNSMLDSSADSLSPVPGDPLIFPSSDSPPSSDLDGSGNILPPSSLDGSGNILPPSSLDGSGNILPPSSLDGSGASGASSFQMNGSGIAVVPSGSGNMNPGSLEGSGNMPAPSSLDGSGASRSSITDSNASSGNGGSAVQFGAKEKRKRTKSKKMRVECPTIELFREMKLPPSAASDDKQNADDNHHIPSAPAISDSDDDMGHFLYLESLEYLMYNTYDVHWYASFALAMCWPKIEISIQRDFAAATLIEDGNEFKVMGSGQLAVKKVKGAVPHDMGNPAEDPLIRVNSYNIQDINSWKDLNSKFVLQCYRDYLLFKDENLLREFYPAITECINHLFQFTNMEDSISSPEKLEKYKKENKKAPYENVMVENEGFPDQTYDAWSVFGCSAYCGGLWLACLTAAKKIAKILGDKQQMKIYSSTLRKAKKVFEKKLWNESGGYYFYDSSSTQVSDSIMADQLAGNWYVKCCELPSIVSEEHAKSSMKTVLRLNLDQFSTNGKLGLVNGMRPNGKVDKMCLQSVEVWTGTCYSVASHLILLDMKEDAMKVVRAIVHSTYDLGYGFQTPEAWDSQGRYRALAYMRPLAIWAVQWAIQLKNRNKK